MRKIIAVVYGGYSPEWIISEKSAKVVYNHLQGNDYEPFLIRISQDTWEVQSDSGKTIPIDKNDFSMVLNGEVVHFDAVFNAIHGTPGEDGKLAGYFEMLNIPYTSADELASSLTFSKSYCNGFLRQFSDINISPSILFKKVMKSMCAPSRPKWAFHVL